MVIGRHNSEPNFNMEQPKVLSQQYWLKGILSQQEQLTSYVLPE